ncbi:hypothetical protein K523DRAFT_325486 [Schizophyllum commune Tattone D]|nr:hypothetical protein K523DRAFT_325486 [Schizophyllum commune Tattone D]
MVGVHMTGPHRREESSHRRDDIGGTHMGGPHIPGPHRRDDMPGPHRRDDIGVPREISGPHIPGPHRRDDIPGPHRRDDISAPHRRDVDMNPPHRRDDMAGPHREISMGQMRRDDIGPVRRDEMGPGRRDEMGGGAYAVAGPSGLRAHGSMEDGKKDKKRKDLSGKLGKEMSDRRDDGRAFAETTTALAAASATLATRPADHPLYRLRLLPYSLERSAALSALDFEEKHALDCVRAAYSDERARVEGEWRAGRERVAARMREGIAERRRRAREEKESEGAAGEGAGARVDVTRKLRRGGTGADTPDGATGGATPGAQRDAGITAGPFRDPLSLSIDEIPSPFALALVSGAPAGGAAAAASAKGKGKRGAGGAGNRMALGQAVVHLVGCKEQDIEQDLGEIRRASKRRRQAVGAPRTVA